MAAEALQFKIGGAEVVSLAALGAVPGVVVALASGRNGPGVGVLRCLSGRLAWKAPGGTFGAEVTPTADGVYCLADGVDSGKFVRVQVWTAWLASGEAAVYLDDVYGNGLCASDLTAADAAAGLVTTVQVTVENAGATPIADIRAWLETVSQPTAPALATAVRAGGVVAGREAGRATVIGGGTAGARGLVRAETARRAPGGAARAAVLGAAWRPTGPAVFALSADGVNYYSPNSEDDGNVIALGGLAAGATATLWVRRTVAAGAAAVTKALTLVRIGWSAFP